jgi:CRP/FNR family cyclic AMP-dependent transcriptional regulator
MSWIDLLGYLGAALTLSVYSMKRMIPLRITGICANCVFIAYGFFGAVYPQMVLHSLLLPINAYRLREMIVLIRVVKSATQTDLDMEWLKPHMQRKPVKRGDVIFRKGDVSDALYLVANGRFRLVEINQEFGSGQVFGEIGLIAPDNRRTLTVECIEEGTLLTVSYDRVKELYFQNPKFGFYFLQLISQRLFKDIDRLKAPQASEGMASAASPERPLPPAARSVQPKPSASDLPHPPGRM